MTPEAKEKARATNRRKREESKIKVKCEFCLLPTEKRFCWEVNIKGPSSKALNSIHDEDRKSKKIFSCHACYLRARPTCVEYCSKLSREI